MTEIWEYPNTMLSYKQGGPCIVSHPVHVSIISPTCVQPQLLLELKQVPNGSKQQMEPAPALVALQTEYWQLGAKGGS